MAAPRKTSAFDRRFDEAARRVLKRRGVPAGRMDEEIARLRRAAPSLDVPTVKELEQKLAELAKPR